MTAPTTDCVFCQIAEGLLPSTRVYEDEYVIAFRDLNPQAPTHVLVIPKQHIPGIADPAAEDGETLARLFIAANKVARDQGIAESGYRLVFNQGGDAGQAVAHLHLHVLGGRPLGWPPG